MELSQAQSLADELTTALRSASDRISVAGSVRRGKPEVKDIEVVAIPVVSSIIQKDMFGEIVSEGHVDLLDARLHRLAEGDTWPWEFDPVLRRDGPHYKRLRHRQLRICVDLFITDERGWGGAMAIRTGPAEFSQALVTLARRKRMHVADGYLIHGHPKPIRDKPGDKKHFEEYPCEKGSSCPLIIPTLEEADFFAALGLPHWDPAARTAELVWKKARMEATG